MPSPPSVAPSQCPASFQLELTPAARKQEDEKPFDVRLSDEAFETYELDPPSYTIQTTKKELKQMYYDMVAVRYAPLATTCAPGWAGNVLLDDEGPRR